MSFLLSSYILCLSSSLSFSHSSPLQQSTDAPEYPPLLHCHPVLITVNYIPLKYYHRRSNSTSSDCHVFVVVKTARPLLNIRALAWGILLSCFGEFRLSRSVMRERDCYLRRRSLCARCHTRWLSIIEWFCEGSMRLGIVFIPLSLWISGPFISALRNSTYSTLS